MSMHSSRGTRFRAARSLRNSGLQSAIFLLSAFVVGAALLLAQRKLVPARLGATYTGRIVTEDSRQTRLYLDIGPCGGIIVTFHQPYVKSPPVGKIACQGTEVDLVKVTQR